MKLVAGNNFSNTTYPNNSSCYSIYKLNHTEDGNHETEQYLREQFPNGEIARESLTVCIFSTSGVHGCYTTIEAAERQLNHPRNDLYYSQYEDSVPTVTYMIIHLRSIKIIYGNIEVTAENLDFLKKVRASSQLFLAKMGGPYS